MIQDIQPFQFSNNFIKNPGINKNDYIFHFKGNTLLLKQVDDTYEIPRCNDIQEIYDEGIFLFSFNTVNCYLVWDCQIIGKQKLAYQEINSDLTRSQIEIDWTSMVAFQLMNWYLHNKFCGKCGAATTLKDDERAITCTACETTIYPNISPAIIVAIFSNDKILLAKGVNFRNNMYSLVAGYVDAGETLEDAVVREVKEEVGLDIKNIRYYKSQPWPHSSSMMIGFLADANEGQTISIDNKEIADAGWYTRNNLPYYPPNRSIAGEIIEKWIKHEL